MTPTVLTSVVDQVVKKLESQIQLEIPSEVSRQASEYYRVLLTRAPLGRLQGDSAEKRAAVVLEICARNVTGKRLLSWSQLGKAVNVKKTSSLEELQQKLSNYMPGTSSMTTQSDSQKVPVKQQRSLRQKNYKVNYSASGRSTDMTSGCVPYTPTILATLVIRVAGHLVDPNGTLKKTVQLLQGLQDFDSGIVHERRGHLNDLKRYAPAYEAAALYHTVKELGSRTDLVGGNEDERSKVKTSNKRTKFSKRESILDAEGELELNSNKATEHALEQHRQQPTMPSQPLSVSDLLDASTDFTYLEFKQVLPRVQKIARRIKELSQKNVIANRDALKSRTASKRSETTIAMKAMVSGPKAVSFISATTSSKQAKKPNEDAAQVRNSGLYHTDNQEITDESSLLDQWKKDVVENARRQYPHLDENAAVCKAADEVLTKYGLQ